MWDAIRNLDNLIHVSNASNEIKKTSEYVNLKDSSGEGLLVPSSPLLDPVVVVVAVVIV